MIFNQALDFTGVEKIAPPGFRMSIGFDLVLLDHISASLKSFGAQFENRLFTPDERAYANSSPSCKLERLAARFAAKEATIKALHFSHAGINWRDIEVCRQDDGQCSLKLHGRAAELADQAQLADIVVSLSHDGSYAGAVVVVAHKHSPLALH